MKKSVITIPLASLLAVVSVSSFSAQAADFVTSFKQCAAEKDSLKRLMCYDNLAKVVNYSQQAPVNLPAVPVASANTVQQVAETVAPAVSKVAPSNKATTVEDAFGAEAIAKNKKDKVEQVYYEIKELTKTLRGKWRFTFVNDQVWEQKDEDSNARFKVGETIIIKRGMFDSFYLKKPDANRTLRVKRIK